MPLWQIDIYPAEQEIDREGQRISEEIHELGLADDVSVTFARGYLVQGDFNLTAAQTLAQTLLADPIAETTVVALAGQDVLNEPPGDDATLVYVLPKPGVMDPVAMSTQAAALDAGLAVDGVRTLRKYWLPEMPADQLQAICRRALSNDSVEQVIVGPLEMDQLDVGSNYNFENIIVPIRDLDDAGLEELSRSGQLYLTLVEMQTIAAHFRDQGRDPTDIELEIGLPRPGPNTAATKHWPAVSPTAGQAPTGPLKPIPASMTTC